jgi:hypothetical protein
MKYYETKDGKRFVENGNSKIRVVLVKEKPSPICDERTLKILSVQEVLRTSGKNPIQVGNLIALSFPNDKLNTKKYEWNKGPHWEESQVPLKLNDHVPFSPKITERAWR